MKRNNAILNPVITWIIAFITMAGIILGVLYAKESGETSVIEGFELFSCDFFATFKSSIITKLIFVILFIIGGVNVFFIPVSATALFFKNYSYGYTAGLMVAEMGKKGAMLCFSGLLLYNFLFTFFSMLYLSFAVNNSLECFLNRRNYDYKVRKNKIFAIITIIYIIMTIFVSLTEASLSSFLYEI